MLTTIHSAMGRDMPEIRLSDRLQNLGTETAFAVSGEASAFAKEGNKVYPFHIGDINMKTPDNIIDAAVRAMREGKTGYCPSAGIPELRDVLAQDVNRTRGTDYAAENIAIQPGGKPVIGKFILTLMNPGDEVLYPNPGYPIYESQIEFHGGTAVPYRYVEGKNNFVLDLDELRSQITPKTKLLVLNDLENPTGAEASHEELEKVAALALEHDLYVLSDEAYFDIRYSGVSESIAGLPGMAERTVIVYTFGKKYAMTGWRLGAAVGPKEIIDVVAKLNVNDESCTNHANQHAAIEALSGDQSGHDRIVAVLKERRDAAADLVNSIPGFRCFRPEATFYLFPNATEAMGLLGTPNYDEFRRRVLHETGVSFCTRAHFGRVLAGEVERYIRLAYSGIDVDQIREGLGRMKRFFEGL